MKQRLTTSRLLLRQPRAEDAAAVFEAWATDTDVLRYLGWRPHERVEQTRAMLAWDQARWIKKSAWTWLALKVSAGVALPIAQVQLLPQRLDGPAHHLRLGYLLGRSHWGQGLMQEALRAVLALAWAEGPVWRIDALCDVDNTASARLLDRLGFEREGLLRRHSLHPNAGSEPRDVWLYACTRQPDARAELASAGVAEGFTSVE